MAWVRSDQLCRGSTIRLNGARCALYLESEDAERRDGGAGEHHVVQPIAISCKQQSVASFGGNLSHLHLRVAAV